MYKTAMRLAFVFLAILSASSCNEILKGALEKGARYEPGNETTSFITDFKVEKGDNNREALVTWTNPAITNFEVTRLLRRTDKFPVSYDDPDAILLYEGTGNKYRDRGLSNNTTYYYGAFPKTDIFFSEKCFFGAYSISDTARDILARSFFILGGSTSYSGATANLIADVDIFDPVTESFYSESPPLTLPNPRMFCAVVSLGGKIYVFGGKNSTPAVSDKVDILDLNVDPPVWTTGTAMLSPRCALSAVTYNGRIYCLGGSTTIVAGGALATNYIYDPGLNSWTQDANLCANLSTARSAFSAVSFRGTLYYYGGVSTTGAVQISGQYRSLLTNQSVALSGLFYYVGCNYAFYHKELNDGGETTFYLTFGGTSQTPQTTLPAGGTYNFATTTVCATYIPNPTGGTPVGYTIVPLSAGTGIEAYTNRAYAGCEYFGNYIYLFGGLTGAGTTPSESTLIERLDVKDGDLFNGEWTQLVQAMGTARYAFGITRVNF